MSGNDSSGTAGSLSEQLAGAAIQFRYNKQPREEAAKALFRIVDAVKKLEADYTAALVAEMGAVLVAMDLGISPDAIRATARSRMAEGYPSLPDSSLLDRIADLQAQVEGLSQALDKAKDERRSFREPCVACGHLPSRRRDTEEKSVSGDQR